MKDKCKMCEGQGFKVLSKEKCPECKGSGKSKSVDLMKLSQKDLDTFLKEGSVCGKCEGTGEVEAKLKCESCNGEGFFYFCDRCEKPIEKPSEDMEICDNCRKKEAVHLLDDSCTLDEVEVGKLYHGTVNSLAPFGAFVDLNSRVRGLVHTSNISQPLEERDEVIVFVKEIKHNGNMDMVPRKIESYQTVEVEKELPLVTASDLSDYVGRFVRVEGEIIQVKQTAGPTIFTVSDESGLISGAAFVRAGERAYPHIDSDMIVTMTGEVTARGDDLQVEVMSMKRLAGEMEKAVWERIESAIDKRAAPSEIEFLVKSDILENLLPSMKDVARIIKKAVIKSRPIILRHHADADGMTAALAIEKAILPLIREVGGQDAEYFFYKRSPSKAPFYELLDVIRDISFALEDASRHGQKMPLVILVDNGSTEEDVPAMKQAMIYDIDMVVVDHHHPDEIVDQYLLAHVNPAHVGGDFGVTTGMLCTEIARMINPSVVNEIKHLPAISAVGDRSTAPEAEKYIDLVSEKYSLDRLGDIALALDFSAFWLKFSSGKGIVDDITNFGSEKRHNRIVSLLCEQANEMISEQMEACIPNVKSRKLPNGAMLNVLDVENYAHKFTFPPPGKTSGEVHDRLIRKFGDIPTITIGYGPDFAVIRSKKVKMNIPRLVRELHQEVAGAGVSGGGHLVVGSIKFVEGKRTEVLASLAQKLGETEVED